MPTDDRVFLLPGEYHVTRRPCQIATLLGSCVAVVLRHKSKPYGAMNHFLLAESSTPTNDKGRYGNLSTETIIWLIRKLDERIGAYEASIYGGAAVVGHLGANSAIGENNIRMAREILNNHGFKIVEEDVGGTVGRRIYFDIDKGSVTVKTMRKTEESEALAKKRADIVSRDTRVLIVDDSPLVRKILSRAVQETPGMEVCGEAEDAYEAREMIIATNPDVISLDIIMPRMDGLKFLQKLSAHFPKPVVICSTIAKDRSEISRKALEYGAVDVVDKDTLELYKGMDVLKRAYIPKLRNAAGKVVRKKIFD